MSEISVTDSIVRNDISEGVVQLSLNRPSSLNALNTELLLQMSVELAKLNQDLNLKVLIIRGVGGKAFVAGADISTLEASSGGKNPKGAEDFIRQGNLVMKSLEEFPCPVISAVDGFCLGGGLELALSGDLIIASTKAKFGLPEISLSLIPGFGGTQRLTQRVGIGQARRIIYTGEMLSADLAERLGLVDLLFAETEFEVKLSEIVSKLSKRSRISLVAAKKAVGASARELLEDGLGRESEIFLELIQTSEAREGLSAFLEKREPKFQKVS